MYADPTQILDARAVAVAAEKTLGVNAEELYPKLLDRSSSFVFVKRKADADDAAALAARKLAGSGSTRRSGGRYPLNSVGAQVLGFAGADNVGLAGLELSLDRVLRGRAGREVVVRDPLGRVVDVLSATDERRGRDVFLTLDRRIQAETEQVLRATVRRWGARSATAIVLEPRTGEVLAMANAPGFDTNRFGEVPPALQRNRAVSDAYEPGSTFKLIPVAGAMSEGLVVPTSTFTLAPTIRVADRVIGEHDPRGTETMSVAQILSQSLERGRGHARPAARQDATRGVDRALRLRPSDRDRLSGRDARDRAAARAVVGLDDRQRADRPGHRGDAAADGRGVRGGRQRRRLGPAAPRRPRRRTASRPDVTAESRDRGRGHPARDDASRRRRRRHRHPGRDPRVPRCRKDRYRGQAGPGGGYSTYNYVASFVGFVPATRPRLVISVAVDEPRGAIWGGVVAAPAFNEIARFCLQYLEVPPDAAPAG